MTARRKSPRRRPNRQAADIRDLKKAIQSALRGIVRDWRELRAPLPVDRIEPLPPNGAQQYRIRGAESYERIQERVVSLAGRVWQLKDGLIGWLRLQTPAQVVFTEPILSTTVVSTTGEGAEAFIEDVAKASIPLLLCADLYNTFKHYNECDRSGWSPFLNGVEFDSSASGTMGIHYDGRRKTADLTVSTPGAVPVRVELCSRTHPVCFGDAVIVIGRAFRHWLPLVRAQGLLSPDDVEDQVILAELMWFEASIADESPFKPGTAVVDVTMLPIADRQLALTSPRAFIEKTMKTLESGTASTPS